MAFNASTSTDPENNISSYGWTFGDGSNPVSGSNPVRNKTYANSGTYDVTLTVTDAGGLTNSVTKQVTVVAPNRPPVAAFTTATQGLKLTVDGSGSSDPDGAADIDSYAWEFGDGETDTGATPPAHTYAAAGTYNVKLTVTDKAGASHEPHPAGHGQRATARGRRGRVRAGTRPTVGAPPTPVAPGPSAPGTSSNYSVSDGVGKINLSAAGSESAHRSERCVQHQHRGPHGDQPGQGRHRRWYLPHRPAAGADQRLVLRRHPVPCPTGPWSCGWAATWARPRPSCRPQTVSGLTVAAGDKLNVKVQATGTSPTTLRAKVWKVGTAEPAAWGASTTDTTAALQGAGSIGFEAYLSGSATNAPQVASFDDLWAGKPQ